MVRLFFATDIHGSDVCFKKFINSVKYYKTDIIILGGDITGKMIVPLIQQPDGTFKSKFSGTENAVKNPEDLEKRIRFNGFYPCRMTANEKAELEIDKSKLDNLFRKLMLETLQNWVRLAEERLKGTNVRCYVTGGNDDPLEIEPILKSSSLVIDPEGQIVEIDKDHEMISSGYSNMTPWKCPRDIPEEALSEKIDAMVSQVRNMQNCIFNFHCPPYDSMIDTAVELDGNLKQVSRGGQPSMIPVGSKAVRASIDKYQPLLGLHGHIHESKGAFKAGRTLCLNPGSEYGEGILRGVIVELDKNSVKSYLFTSG